MIFTTLEKIWSDKEEIELVGSVYLCSKFYDEASTNINHNLLMPINDEMINNIPEYIPIYFDSYSTINGEQRQLLFENSCFRVKNNNITFDQEINSKNLEALEKNVMQ